MSYKCKYVSDCFIGTDVSFFCLSILLVCSVPTKPILVIPGLQQAQTSGGQGVFFCFSPDPILGQIWISPP